MKKSLHPDNYQFVVFQDTSNGFTLLTRSTATSDEKIKWEDGNEYPLIKTHISSSSHPFFTGEERVVDVEGRVDRFKARQKAADERREKLASKSKKQAARKARKADASEEPEQPVAKPEKTPAEPAVDAKTEE